MANVSKREKSPVATATIPSRDSEAARLDEAIRRGDAVVRYRGVHVRVEGGDRSRQLTVGPFRFRDIEGVMDHIDEVADDPELRREVMRYTDDLLGELTRRREALVQAGAVA